MYGHISENPPQYLRNSCKLEAVSRKPTRIPENSGENSPGRVDFFFIDLSPDERSVSNFPFIFNYILLFPSRRATFFPMNTSPFVRDEHGVLHVIALSGGHDSTALAFLLREQHPFRPFNYVCTPTGNELPAMFAHWIKLGERLGRKLIPIMAGTLHGIIREEKMLPNFRARFCTRRLKIEPYRKFLIEQAALGPVVSYVGLRADEEGRAGGAYDDIDGVEMRFPLREMNFGEDDVQATLRRFDIVCPDRTDCGDCYHQRLGEWYEYWRDHRVAAMKAVSLEKEIGATLRSPGRDNWPVALADLFAEFERGRVPTISLNRMKRERMAAGSCRVCAL